MKILFGEIPAQYKEDFGDSGFISQSVPGEYYYKLEMLYPGEFKLMDTVGRYLPFGYEHLNELILALQTLRYKTADHLRAVETSTKALQELNIVVG